MTCPSCGKSGVHTCSPQLKEVKMTNKHGPEPMTDERIVQLSLEWPADTNDWATHIDFARAIIAARDSQWREWTGKQEQAEPSYFGLTKDHLWMSISREHAQKLKTEVVMKCYATPPATTALLRQALEALEESRDDVSELRTQISDLAGYARYDRRIAAYTAQLEKHDAAITAIKQHLGEV